MKTFDCLCKKYSQVDKEVYRGNGQRLEQQRFWFVYISMPRNMWEKTVMPIVRILHKK